VYKGCDHNPVKTRVCRHNPEDLSNEIHTYFLLHVHDMRYINVNKKNKTYKYTMARRLRVEQLQIKIERIQREIIDVEAGMYDEVLIGPKLLKMRHLQEGDSADGDSNQEQVTPMQLPMLHEIPQEEQRATVRCQE